MSPKQKLKQMFTILDKRLVLFSECPFSQLVFEKSTIYLWLLLFHYGHDVFSNGWFDFLPRRPFQTTIDIIGKRG
jgi:hypothetical protein